MIAHSQKMLLHIYAQAADLSDPTYRNYLAQAAGVASAADPAFTQDGFDVAMAALETVLFQRVDAGEVEDPRGRNRYIRDEFYWRNKLPRSGLINSRQAHRIKELWGRLCEWLPPEQRNLDYLGAIVRKSTGKRDPGWSALTSYQASHLIDALQDRLAHALKNAQITRREPELEEAPF